MISEYINSKSKVVDATCGNGHDTLFLSNIVTKGHIYTFDIQKEAIENAKKLVNATNVTYINDSHENVLDYVKEVDAAIFNLGYLPNSESATTTNYKTTISAVDNILKILSKDGIIVITVYIGHKEGRIESKKLMKYVKKLNRPVSIYKLVNRKNAPFVITIK